MYLNPYRDFWSELHRLQDGINSVFSGNSVSSTQNYPPVNVYSSAEAVAITTEIPGVEADQLEISIKTVEAQMSKALRLMREHLKDFLVLLITLLGFG